MPQVKHLAQPTLKGGGKEMSENKKGMSPVVTSIILIAVTVAVSIAVAAWMGALTFSFMKHENENMAIIGVKFNGASGNPSNSILLRIVNNGTDDFTLSSVKINETAKDFNGTQIKLSPNQKVVIEVYNVQWQSEYKITITVISTRNRQSTIEITPW